MWKLSLGLDELNAKTYSLFLIVGEVFLQLWVQHESLLALPYMQHKLCFCNIRLIPIFLFFRRWIISASWLTLYLAPGWYSEGNGRRELWPKVKAVSKVERIAGFGGDIRSKATLARQRTTQQWSPWWRFKFGKYRPIFITIVSYLSMFYSMASQGLFYQHRAWKRNYTSIVFPGRNYLSMP